MPEDKPLSDEGYEVDDSPTPEDKAVLESMSRGEQPEPEAAPPAPVEPTVPLNSLREERQKRQQLESRLREMEEGRRIADERLRGLFSAQQQAAPAPDPMPDREADPLAWVDWRVRQMEQQTQYADRRTQEAYNQAQQAQAYAAQADYAQRILASEQAARATNPAYDPALQHLQSSVDKILTPAFPDPQRRGLAIAHISQLIVNESMMTGKNPAQVVYETAIAMGASPAQAQALGQATAAAQAPTSQVGSLNRAHQAARTLSQVQGTSPQSMPTINDIAAMSDEEWSDYRAKNPRIAEAIMNGQYKQ